MRSDEILDTISENKNYDIEVNKTDDRVDVIYDSVKKLYEQNSMKVKDVKDSGTDKILVYDNEKLVAESSIESILNSIVLTNSDQYMTQRNQMDNIDFPDVITNLTNKQFTMKGYPKGNNQKLILILISRYIEKLSYDKGGTHRATFQNISRLDDEKGTLDIYKQLDNRCKRLHLYGYPDVEPIEIVPDDMKATIHLGHSDFYEGFWCVTHNSDDQAAALLAVEHDNKNIWEGVWTFDNNKVKKVENMIERLS